MVRSIIGCLGLLIRNKRGVLTTENTEIKEKNFSHKGAKSTLERAREALTIKDKQ
jgi:hypothetical protein